MAVADRAQLVWCPHPIIPAQGRELIVEPLRAGESIAAYLDRVGVRLGARPARLWIEGREVPRTMWPRTRPRAGTILHLQAVAEGGGDGGSNPLRIVLQIAVLIAAAYTGGLSLGAFTIGEATISYASVAAGVIAIGGNLLINALIPAPRQNLGATPSATSPTYALTGGSNRARPYEPLPIVLGAHRLFPDLGARPYTEANGADQYLYQVFNFGLSDLALSDWRIGDSDLLGYQDIALEISGRDGALAGFPGNVDTAVGADLTAAVGWITRTTGPDTVAFAVEIGAILFATGKKGLEPTSVQIEMVYRAVGASDWLPIVSTDETLYRDAYWSAGYWTWEAESGQVWVQVAYGSTDPGEHAEGDLLWEVSGETSGSPGTGGYWSAGYDGYDPNSGNYWQQLSGGDTNPDAHTVGDYYIVDGDVLGTWRWFALGDATATAPQGWTQRATWRYRPYDEVASPFGGAPVPAPAPERAYFVRVPYLTLTGQDQTPIRASYRVDVPEGQYEVRLRRITADSADTSVTSQTTWSQLRSYQRDGADYRGQLRAALRIRASGQLNGTIAELSVYAEARCWMWTGTAWQYGTTRNPAWWYLHWARGRVDVSGRRVYGAGLPDSRIDFDRIFAWASFCGLAGYEIGVVIDTPMSVAEVLEHIARTGRGAPTWQSGKLGVVWDAPSQPAVAIFGMPNIVAGSFRVEYVTGQLADEVVASYIDRDADWKQNTVRALVPGVTSPTHSAPVSLVGIIDRSLAQRHANLLAAQQYYRRRTITWEADWEGMVCQRGDVAILSHDLTQWDYSGRVIACADSTHLTLDREVPQSSGNWLLLRAPNGYTMTISTAPAGGDSAAVTLYTPIPVTDDTGASLPLPGAAGPAFDWTWTFGPRATPGKRVKITAIQPRSESRVQLVATDEEDAYYACETNLGSAAPAPVYTRLVAVVRDLRIGEVLIPRSGGRVRITATWGLEHALSALVTAAVNGAQVFAREQSDSTLTLEVHDGDRVDVVVQPLPAGSEGRLTYSVIGRLAPPADVAGFGAALVGADALLLHWQPVPDLDLDHYEIRHSPLTTGALYETSFVLRPYVQGTTETVTPRSGTYFVRAWDEIGRASLNPAVVVTTQPDLIGLNLIATQTEDPTWPGAKAGLAVASGALVLDSAAFFDALAGDFDAALGTFDAGGAVQMSGTYVTSALDLGARYLSRVSAGIETGVIDYATTFDTAEGRFDDRAGLFDANESAVAAVSIGAEIDTSPNGSTWDGWRPYVAGDYDAQAVRLRLTLASSSAWVTPVVTALTMSVDMPDRVESGNLSVAAGGSTVTFAAAYHSAPRVAVTGQFLAAGDTLVVGTPSASGFSVQVLDSTGSGVSRVIDWVAHGPGLQV